MITLTFDDGYMSQKEHAMPLLGAHGFKASFYIITDYLKEGEYPEYVKSSDVAELFAAGHEIGSHTKSHPYLSRLSSTQVSEELRNSKSLLQSAGWNPQTFVYPYGDYDERAVREVQDAGYIAARSVRNGFNDKNADRYLLRCQAVYRWTPFFLIRYWIDKAEREGTWLILMLHQIDTTRGYFGTTPKMLEKIVSYVAQKKIVPVTMEEGTRKTFSILN